MLIKKNDFINVDFIGKITETGDVFDVTQEDLAKKYNVHSPKAHYHALTICVGEKHVVPGLDEFLEGKEPGKYSVNLTPEQAFGKKDPKLMRLIPLNVFHKHNMRPEVGLHINMDGAIGVVRSVSGGRVIMDFNHPLAGKNVTYDITINKLETDPKEK
ncbi:MAG: peptidylprolyl isomerase, partial [Nanoarchaeota archaeon]|nr:peptidylprolyl isomerase [Nanoarchaeota archaeon]